MSLHVESSGAGPDVALLHGWGLHSGVWSEALPALAGRFCVHAVDLPGHGFSRSAAVNGFDEGVDAVAAALPPGSIVCGWSLGGLVAQRLARRHRERVRALCLVSSTPCFVERDDWPHGMRPDTLAEFASGLAHDRDATLARFVQLNALHGARGREAVRAFTRRLGERGAAPAAALAASLGWLRDVDLRADARSIGVRTIVIHGGRDMLAPVEAGRWLARAIPGARLVEVPDAAHLPFFTHRESFLQAMESFVG